MAASINPDDYFEVIPSNDAEGNELKSVDGTEAWLIVDVLKGYHFKRLSECFDKIDPFVKIRVGSVEVQTTAFENEHKPVWNERFAIPLNGEAVSAGEVNFEIMDSDAMGASTKAKTTVPLPAPFAPFTPELGGRVECETVGSESDRHPELDVQMVLMPVRQSLKLVTAAAGLQVAAQSISAEKQEAELVVEQLGAELSELKAEDEVEDAEMAAVKGELESLKVSYADSVLAAKAAEEQLAEAQAAAADARAGVGVQTFFCGDGVDVTFGEAGKELCIIGAMYGSGDVCIDCKEAIQGAVDDGVFSHGGGIHTLVGDPVGGVAKTFVCHYTITG